MWLISCSNTCGVVKQEPGQISTRGGYVVNNGQNCINLVCERPLIASIVDSRQSELNSSHPGKEKMWLISCSNTCGVVEREPAQRLLNT